MALTCSVCGKEFILVIAWEGGQFGINCTRDEKSILNCQSEARAIFIDVSSRGQFIPNLPDMTCYYVLIVEIFKRKVSYKNTNSSMKRVYVRKFDYSNS